MTHPRCLLFLAALFAAGCAGSAIQDSAPWQGAYARHNLKVLGDNQITWINWQASPGSIPVGTPLQVRASGERGEALDPATEQVYKAELGADRPEILWKFFSRTPPDLSAFSAQEREHILAQVAKVGMGKDAVFVAMGPPAQVIDSAGQKHWTNAMTYEEIRPANTWIYARRRAGKNIGVAFSPTTGLVERTEGIWGK